MNSPGVILSKKYRGHTQRHDVKQCELPLLLSDNSQHLRMDTWSSPLKLADTDRSRHFREGTQISTFKTSTKDLQPPSPKVPSHRLLSGTGACSSFEGSDATHVVHIRQPGPMAHRSGRLNPSLGIFHGFHGDESVEYHEQLHTAQIYPTYIQLSQEPYLANILAMP